MIESSHPEVKGFFDPVTATITYVVSDPETRDCAVIDPVLDFSATTGRVSTASADRVVAWVRSRGMRPQWLLDTHIHADHMSALAYLREALGGATGIGARVGLVQGAFQTIYNADSGFRPDGSQFDHTFDDGEIFSVGNIPAEVFHAPGHTPACVAYHIGDALFTGDVLLMPDFGTARCDFPGGDARALYTSIRRLFALPADTRVFVGHDYAPGGRPVAWETTLGAERDNNVHVREGVGEDDFVRLRTQRDATLEVPALMLAAVQVNICAGRLPPPEPNGVSYLKIPVIRA